ncbi:immunity protein YezG family protein [Niallia taxi]|uniref:immunity protein YezG family protein n=1 Tax=Niallia taxi TaxID=2499688 RepID=UPI002E214107|nr:DUF600 family protein [Niallia taxi]
MSFEIELNKLYKKIAQQINDMIPTEWDKFWFNGEIKDEEGGVFFFFTPKDEEQHVFSHYIPRLYNVDKRVYNRELHQLFQLTVELQRVFIDNEEEPWFSITLVLTETGKLNVHFDYTNWHISEFGPTDRIKYYEHKYIRSNKEQQDLDLIMKMGKFIKK